MVSFSCPEPVNRNFARAMGIQKEVTIINSSGKTAFVIVSSAPIKSMKRLALRGGAAGCEASTDMEFEKEGEYKQQKISIADTEISKLTLDNSQFYCTLFFDVDGEWQKCWDNRRFDGRKNDIELLKKHVAAALKKDNIPNF